jgi:hypothetical protein
LPGDLDLSRLARETGALVRPRGVRDAESLLRLALARGPGGLSIKDTAAWAELMGVAQLSGPALHDRLHQSVGFLDAIVRHLLEDGRSLRSPLWAGRHLRIVDSTSLSQPGSKGTDWRVHAVYDLGAGGFTHLELTDAKGGERFSRGPPARGELRVGDRGFCTGPELARYLEQAGQGGADFIVRLRWNTLPLRDGKGDPFDLIRFLEDIPRPEEARSVGVNAVIGRHRPLLPLRVVAWRLPEEQAEANRKRLVCKASRQQTTPDPRSLIAAGVVMLATTLPDEIPAEEVLTTYRRRWQIELAFKRLKSLLHIDRIPTHTQAGGQAWLYAHLILALLCDTMNQDLLAFFPLRAWLRPAPRHPCGASPKSPSGRCARPCSASPG